VTYSFVFTPTARADAIEAFRWIAEHSPDAAARWYASLEKAIATLSTLPERHPIAEEISEHLGITVRQMAYGRSRGVFRVLFSIQAETVYLHYVRHSARGPIETIGST
jgi:plasmid stabilization system protein ParE